MMMREVRCQGSLKEKGRDTNELEPFIIWGDRVVIFPGSKPIRQACLEELGTGITLHGPHFAEQPEHGNDENLAATAGVALSLPGCTVRDVNSVFSGFIDNVLH